MHDIAEGELLPSIRQLSRDLKVSVITTTRAYTDLENDEYIMIENAVEVCVLQSVPTHSIFNERCYILYEYY